MLEPIEYFLNNTKYNYSECNDITTFLLFYNSENGSKIFTENKLFNIIRHFKLYDGYNIDDIGDFGEYFEKNHHKLIEFEKQRQRFYGNGDKLLPKYIETPVFLIVSYNRLKRSIQNRTQYKILKDTLICLSPLDSKHFINMLLRKYTTTQINNLISEIKKSQTKK